MTAAPPKAAPKKNAGDSGKKPPLPPKAGGGFLSDDSIALDVVVNEQVESAQHRRMLSVVFAQTVVITLLTLSILVLGPLLQPVYHYYALNPAGEVMQITGLTMPNMTNQAILSWTINSVTEIMTIGFGDFDRKLDKQRLRFTADGWNSFVSDFLKQGIGDIFKHNQLVLTTVPSNVPVILSQGKNKEDVYEWKVQVPVIMTYTTNNNVTQREKTVVTLTIVRVPTNYNPEGIAIKVWHVQA